MSTRRIWDKGDDVDAAMMRYTARDDWRLDQRLLPYDLTASIAHVRGLGRIGVLDEDERDQLVAALETLLAHVHQGEMVLTEEDEDGHGAIEAALAPDEPEEDESSNDLPAAHNSEEILKRDQRIAELERRLSIAEKTANLRGNTLLRQHTLIRQAFSSADQLASMLDIAPPDEMPVDYLEIPAQGGGGSEREPDQDGAVKTAPVKPQRAPSNGAGQGVTDGETSQKSKGNHPPRHQRILDALAWSVKMLSRDSVDRKIVAWFADTSPKSSGYEKDLGAMRTAGLIEYPGRGLVALTQAGGELANWPASPPTQAEFVAAIKRKLEPRHGRILDGVLAYQGRSIDRETLASDIGTSVISSGFQKDLGKLRTLGLIDYPKPGLVELGAVFV